MGLADYYDERERLVRRGGQLVRRHNRGVEKLNTEVEAVNTEGASVNQSIEQLKGDSGVLNTRISDLKSLADATNADITSARTSADALNTDITGLNGQASSINSEIEQLKATAAPHEKVVSDYNAQVTGFKNSAVRYRKGDEDVLWEIIGWTIGGKAYQPVKYESMSGNYDSGLLVSGQIPYAPMWKDVVAPAGGAAYAGGWTPYLITGGYIGGHTWADSPTATLRTSDGTPIASAGNLGDVYNPLSMYATYNDKPYFAPPTKEQAEAAKAADTTLSGLRKTGDQLQSRSTAINQQSGEIASRRSELQALDATLSAKGEELKKTDAELRAQAEALKGRDATLRATSEQLTSKGNSLVAQGQQMQDRFDRTGGLLTRKVGRIDEEIVAKKMAAAKEAQQEQTGGSVFDQNKVFQSISDWLR